MEEGVHRYKVAYEGEDTVPLILSPFPLNSVQYTALSTKTVVTKQLGQFTSYKQKTKKQAFIVYSISIDMFHPVCIVYFCSVCFYYIYYMGIYRNIHVRYRNMFVAYNMHVFTVNKL